LFIPESKRVNWNQTVLRLKRSPMLSVHSILSPFR
jgi:hypothetical protein